MDKLEEYIWQRRIHHGVRYQKGATPFPECVAIGLEFNAALERKEKLDLSLLTNGVLLEICDFAKTVTKSESYFLFEMLDFNFNLGLDADNDFQQYDFARRVHNKTRIVSQQIKLKPRRWKEPFCLPELGSIQTSMVPGFYCPKKKKMYDISVLTNGTNNNPDTENNDNETVSAASNAFVITKRGRETRYSFCRELGVTLTIQPENPLKEKLDPSVVTNGVMMELLDFCKVLCGTHVRMINELVMQNFGQEFEKGAFRFQLSKLLERKYACLTAEDKEEFRKEVYPIHMEKREPRRQKRKNPEDDYEELERQTMVSKRRETLRHTDSEGTDMWQDGDMSYMCPVDFETEANTETRPANIDLENCLDVKTLDVKQEEEEVYVSEEQIETNSNTYSFYSNPKSSTVMSMADVFFEDTCDEASVKSHKQKLWTRRVPRSKQILRSIRVNDRFERSREIRLDYNVGSGNKQRLDLQLFSNRVMWEVFRFASMMTKSSCPLLLEILNNNFTLVLQNDLHQRNFLFYMTTKEKNIQVHSERWNEDFLNRPFQFPEVYNMVDVTNDIDTPVPDLETQQQTNSDPQAPSTNQDADMEKHPFCKKVGINLWSAEECPISQKLDLTVLTTGAVLEIFSFVRELCGNLKDMVNDVLEHNFDLELHSRASVAAKTIQKWYHMQKIMKKNCVSPKITRWFKSPVLLDSNCELDPKPQTSTNKEELHAEIVNQDRDTFNGIMEEEVKPVHSFHICKEIGLDLDIGSRKSEAKTKLSTSVLTRAVLYEMHLYVQQNCQRYVPALYEILEFNFDLSSQRHRRVEFAWSIASQALTIAKKFSRKELYRDRVFELPFEDSEGSKFVCKEEPEDDGFGDMEVKDKCEVTFVRELKPVDIEVTVE